MFQSQTLRRVCIGLAGLAGLLVLAVPAGSVYYAAAGGLACIRCHEVEPAYHLWTESTHRSVQCKECHGSLFTTDVGFHLNNARQLWLHIRGQAPERLLIRQQDISRGMNERCGNCHRREYAAWAAGPHHATYARIFLDSAHNKGRLLNDQCLQCHGMYFDKSIRDLVRPLDRKGPWELVAASVQPLEPSIPCLACHEVHRPGTPLGLRPRAAAGDDSAPPSPAAFYDRREQVHYPAELLPLPAMLDGARPVAVSPDPRQALCYQCHAPDFTLQAGSGDDRTCVGVHEGLSCLACHGGHDQDPRASCVQCHPRMSNCGIDVGRMDTTFRSAASRHNIHFVKCADCHSNGVPAGARHR